MSEVREKPCSGCGKVLPATAEYFHRDKTQKDGLRYICKSCACAVTRMHATLDPEKKKRADWEYRVRNIEKRREYSRKRYQEHREEYLAYCRDYYQRNADYIKLRVAEWQRTHSENKRMYHSRRKALKLENGGTHTDYDIRAQYRSQDGRCFYCGEEVGDKYHVDHFIPLALGGSNGPENIVIACPTCNCRKRAKLPEDFLAMLA